jgi:outer membrane protein assembly factor BamB
MPVHLVSSIDTREFGSEDVRIGDLNGDGAPDLLFAQGGYGSEPIECTREIRCLTATTISGELLWQSGEPSVQNGCWGDLPLQIYDWDNDGENEVVLIRQAVYAELYPSDPKSFRGRAKRFDGTATLVVLNGRTGREKRCFAIPAPADDSITFADLTGQGWRGDIVVKDAWENIYGISRTGEFLWQWHGGPWPVAGHNLPYDPPISIVDEKCHACHYPAVADVDGDGCDEVFIGFALLDHDGRVLFRKDCQKDEHSDANYISRLYDGSWRLMFGNGGVHCLTVDGTELWHNPLVFNEAQHVVAGRFRSDSQLQVAVIDRGSVRTIDGPSACLYLFDVETGKEIWRRPQLPGGWCAACADICWCANGGLKEILVYKRGNVGSPIAVYDGQGDIVDEMEVPASMCSNEDNLSMYPSAVYPGLTHECRHADLWGDSREEVIAFGRNGLRIYSNARPVAIATLYNQTVYHGM